MVYFIIFVFYRNFYIDATLHQVIREMGRIDTLEQFTHKPLTRRNFLTQTLRSGFGLAVGMTSLGLPLACTGRKITVSEKKQDIFQPYRNKKQKKLPITSIPLIKEAMYYKKLIHGRVQCELCFRKCIIYRGQRGECRNRENYDGTLYTLVYGKPSAIQLDPIEKEPQHHMLPGTYILCFGTAGCNFHCRFCQNWHLSQRSFEEMDYYFMASPEAVVPEATKLNIPTLSFTYNDPIAFYEYMYDMAKAAKSEGLNILWHSNGTLNPAPLKDMLRFTDAVTIDLKGFQNRIYYRYCSAELEPALQSLKIIREAGVWLEIVNLVIPTVNDDPDDIRKMCIWIRDNLGTTVPTHFSRFFPQYKLTNLPPTPVETLEKAYHIARDVGLEYVCLGNVPGHRLNSTYCPKCGNILIERIHFQVVKNNLEDGNCSACGHPIPGIWQT